MCHYWVKKQEMVFLLCLWATIFYLTQNWLKPIFFVINIFNYFALEIKLDEKCSASRRPIRFIAAGQMQAMNSKSCRLNIICVLEFFFFLSIFQLSAYWKAPQSFFPWYGRTRVSWPYLFQSVLCRRKVNNSSSDLTEKSIYYVNIKLSFKFASGRLSLTLYIF